MNQRLRPWMLIVVAHTIGLLVSSSDAGEPPKSPQAWLSHFERTWDDSTWMPNFPGRAGHSMRPLDDTGWHSRMEVLQALVAAGPSAVEPLTKLLRDGDAPGRILAAQALSFLAPVVPRDALVAAARNDPEAAVRLYAVDALGMQGVGELTDQLVSLRESEKDGDVRKHLGYALQRKSNGVLPATADTLVGWNPQQINSAVVGQPAPDFALESLGGETIRLSDFRGNKPVVLVFIYGDT